MTLQELIAYVIIAMAAAWCLRRIYLTLTRKRRGSCCASCTADCQLRGSASDKHPKCKCPTKAPKHKRDETNK